MGEQADAPLERLVGSLIGTAEMMNVYLGDRLGLYAPLAETWLTSSELAAEAQIAGTVRARMARGTGRRRIHRR